jgi:hypothetical protein
MSLVGPRPEVPRYVAHYPPGLRERALAVRPGITDPASLAFIDEAELLARAADPEREYIERILPRKLQAAADYAERATLWTDLRVLLRTLRVLLRKGRPRERACGRGTPSGTARRRAGAAAPAPRAAVAGGRRAGHRRLLERHLPVPPGLRALDQRAAGLRRLGAAGVVALYLVAFAACACRRACGASPASARSSG